MNCKRFVIMRSRLNPGQRVLLYKQGTREIIASNGRSLGKKRYVEGTGYVSQDGTHVESEKLGKVRLIYPIVRTKKASRVKGMMYCLPRSHRLKIERLKAKAIEE